MKKKDYIFSVGFDGNKAIVDKRSQAIYGRLDVQALLEKGLFRAAYLSSIFDKDSVAAGYILEKLRTFSSVKYEKSEELMKVFGAQIPSDDITGIRRI